MNKLPAGPELDRLIAEKVMGWALSSEHGWSINAFTNGRCISQSEVFESYENGSCARIDFKPSSDIAHAWEVVEKMRTLGFRPILMHIRLNPYHDL